MGTREYMMLGERGRLILLWTTILNRKNGTIIPLSPKAMMKGVKEQKPCHFGIIEIGGEVVQMFHLFCPRL